MNPITCRPATESDIPLVRELARRIWHACYPGIITVEQIEFMLGWMYAEEKIREELRAGYTWEVVEEGPEVETSTSNAESRTPNAASVALDTDAPCFSVRSSGLGVRRSASAIGFLSFSSEADGRVKLHKMYVLPEHQRRGIGQQLLAHVCQSARALGARAVWMQVNKRNERAIAAYLKAGFRVEREAVFDIGGGYVMDDYLMEKVL